ncbi:BolA family transcriptional regulator [Hylemonella gracilis]|uniref:BolA family transcriptional regulator n=1 Tax=Hylemonella gracilis TaxID=80880 RepID=A0A4P6UMS3_9BURK|nr:BolA family protein [Hylemonella gracilis]QBK05520.1 BolA family transcriptional regulator [Hylemonella gracilis]
MNERDMAARMHAVLQERLQTTALEVLDESAAHLGHAGSNGTGYGTHFRVRIASPRFAGQARLAQHRLVYDALHDFFDPHNKHSAAAGTHGEPRGSVHALAIEIL